LVKYYQKALETLQNKFCLQETIISRLQQYLNTNLNKEVEERLQYKFIESKMGENQGLQREYGGITNLCTRVFDFYGHHVRINEFDKDKFIKDVLIMEQQEQIANLKVQIKSGDNQFSQQGELLQRTVENEINLKIDLHEANRRIEELR
jgi:hypothetical protein